MKKFCLLLFVTFSLNACHALTQKHEEILPPEVIELDFAITQNSEVFEGDGPWIIFCYRVKNAEWLQLELDHQWIERGPVSESDLSASWAFPLSDCKEMTFTVTARNSVGTLSREVTYRK